MGKAVEGAVTPCVPAEEAMFEAGNELLQRAPIARKFASEGLWCGCVAPSPAT